MFALRQSTGIVRRADRLGRVVIPVETRRLLGIRPNDELEFFVDGDTLVLNRRGRGCVFCGAAAALEHAGRLVCMSCAAQLGRRAASPDGAPG